MLGFVPKLSDRPASWRREVCFQKILIPLMGETHQGFWRWVVQTATQLPKQCPVFTQGLPVRPFQSQVSPKSLGPMDVMGRHGCRGILVPSFCNFQPPRFRLNSFPSLSKKMFCGRMSRCQICLLWIWAAALSSDVQITCLTSTAGL